MVRHIEPKTVEFEAEISLASHEKKCLEEENTCVLTKNPPFDLDELSLLTDMYFLSAGRIGDYGNSDLNRGRPQCSSPGFAHVPQAGSRSRGSRRGQ